MDFNELFENRRSVRSYKDEELEEKIIFELIKAAISAPSAGNIQPWEFIIIRKKQIKEQLVMAALGQTFITEAPVVIVVCADMEKSGKYYGKRGAELYCIQDTAAAIENLILYAKFKGLGTCWIGAFSEKNVSEILNIPSGLRPIAIICIGLPAETPKKPYKRPVEKVIHYEKF
jgi:nitroreductase